jgi:hypothetical protein
VLLGLLLLAHGCGETAEGILVAPRLTAELPAPAAIEVSWSGPGSAAAAPHRRTVPVDRASSGGALPTVFLDLRGRPAGERRIVVRGTGGAREAIGALRVSWERGQVLAPVHLVAALPDTDGDGIPDEVDDACDGCPEVGAGVPAQRDASAPAAAGVDGAPRDVASGGSPDRPPRPGPQPDVASATPRDAAIDGPSGALVDAVAVERVPVEAGGLDARDDALDAASFDAAPSLGFALVGYWRFDEGAGGATTRDWSGNGNPGLLRNFPAATTWAPGRFGSALRFGTGHVQVNPSASLDSARSAITIALWIHREAVQSGWRNLVGRQYGTTHLEDFGLSYSDGVLACVVQDHAGGPLVRAAAASPVGRWLHVAMTFDGRVLRLYEQGLLLEEKAWAGSISTGTRPITIGAAFNGSNDMPVEHVDGRIDDVAIWARALDEAELARLAAGEQPPGR